MNNNLLTYNEFGKLRFLDFFPITSKYDCNDVGGIMTTIGYSCVEGTAENAFAWRENGGKQTGVIMVQFESDFSSYLIHALLDRVGIPLRSGMSRNEVWVVLGDEDSDAKPSDRFSRHTVGETERYYIFCNFNDNGKLYGVSVSRKDYTDENNVNLGIS